MSVALEACPHGRELLGCPRCADPVPTAPSDSSGDPEWPSVPGFVIKQELARGGQAVVYLANQEALNRIVALKVLRPEVSGRTELRFEAEGRTIAALGNRAFVQAYAAGKAGAHHWIALEYVAGGSLRARLGKILPTSTAALLLLRLADAMAFAHQRNVVHRDLKPDNILVEQGQEVPLDACRLKICDFGLGKQLQGHLPLTATGDVFGTPPYMAPEQVKGDVRSINSRTDVYALGAILYELLTGRPPFCGATVADILSQVCHTELVKPRALNPQVPRELEDICLHCLQRKAGDRYPDAGALADDLRRFFLQEPVQAPRERMWHRVWHWALAEPKVVGLCLALFVSTVGLLGVLSWNYQRLAIAHAREAAHRQELEESQRSLTEAYTILADLSDRSGQKPSALAYHRRTHDVFARLAQTSPSVSAYRRFQAQASYEIGALLRVGHDSAGALEAYREAAQLLRGLLAEGAEEKDRLSLARVLTDMGNLLRDMGRNDEADAVAAEAATLREVLVAGRPDSFAYRSDLAQSYTQLGRQAQLRGRLSQAAQFHTWARDQRRALLAGAVTPDQEGTLRRHLAWSEHHLGRVLRDQGRFPEAREALEQARSLREALLQRAADGLPQPLPSADAVRTQMRFAGTRPAMLLQETAYSYADLGKLLAATGKSAEARVFLDRAVEARRGQLALEPTPVSRHELARALHDLADWHREHGDPRTALPLFEEALRLREALVAQDSRDQAMAADLALGQHGLGQTLRKLGRHQEAAESLQQAVAGRAALAKQIPDVPDHANALAESLRELSAVRVALGDKTTAREHLMRAGHLQRSLVNGYPEPITYRVNLAAILFDLGCLHRATGEIHSAMAELGEAAEHLKTIQQSAPQFVAVGRELDEVLCELKRTP